MKRRYGSVLLAGVLFSLMLCFFFFTGTSARAEGANRIHFIPLGYSNATLVESNGHYALIDAGDPTARTFELMGLSYQAHNSTAVVEYLRSLGVSHLDVVITSHSHWDHTGGIPEIAEEFCDSSTTYYYRGLYRTVEDELYPKFKNYEFQRYAILCMRRAGAKCVSLMESNITSLSIPVGELTLTLYNIGDYDGDGKTDYYYNSPDPTNEFPENYNSIATLIEGVGSTRILLTADNLGVSNERLAEEVGQVDILELSHNGCAKSGLVKLLTTCKPETAVAFHCAPTTSFRNLGMVSYLNSIGCDTYWLAGEDGTTGKTPTGDAATVITLRSDGYEVTGNTPGTMPDYTGWTYFDHERVYLRQGSPVHGWFSYRGNWYYMDPETGVRTKGFIQVGRKYYYMNSDGTMFAETGWQEIEENTYYLLDAGNFRTGWYIEDGIRYYFDPDSGKLVKGNVFRNVGGKRYFFDEQGAAASGWFEYEGDRYWADPVTCALATGAQSVDGKLYYFDSDGVLREGKGWQKLDGKWYFLNDDSTLATGLLKDGGSLYLMGDDGAMVTGPGWVKRGNAWYYATKTGALKTGWVRSGKKWYYLDPSTGKMRTGWLRSGGEWYYLDPGDGHMWTGGEVDGWSVGEDGTAKRLCRRGRTESELRFTGTLQV